MSSVQQAVFMNQRSFGPPSIGSAYEGGFYVGQISTSADGVATHNLIVAPLSTGQSTKQWKNANSATPGANSDIDGPQNTADMVADGNSTVYPAAHFCNDAVIGGFSDWYMPARNELEICYYNLKPTTTNNSTGGPGNPNAVPSRATGYTNSPRVPDQTSAADFQSGGAEAFAANVYWSSTELSTYTNYARMIFFGNGGQSNPSKTSSYLVRAVRRVAV